MKKEYWQYISDNWGSTDQAVMEQIAKYKDEDTISYSNLEKDLAEKEKNIQSLTQQNISLNRTNMDLVLRLTDPKTSAPAEEIEEEYKAPNINDLDAFVRIE